MAELEDAVREFDLATITLMARPALSAGTARAR